MKTQILGVIGYNFGVLLSIQPSIYQPYELVFGKSCILPNNLVDKIDPLYNPDNYVLELRYRLQKANLDARKNLIKSKESRKIVYDKNCKRVMYEKDDLILIRKETGTKMDKL